jgi:Bacterial surface protein, Ig-like domain
MKTKNFMLAIFGMFILVMALGMTSASSLTITPDTTETQTINDVAGTATITFDLTNTGAESTGLLWSTTTISGGDATISFNISSIALGTLGSPIVEPVTATITFSNSDLGSGISGTIIAHGNGGTENPTPLPFTITIADTTIPAITLLGDATVTLGIGETYTDAGATALDNVDGDLTSSIVTVGSVIDTSTSGTHTITYDATDSALNAATQVTRTVKVVQYPDDITEILEDVDYSDNGNLVVEIKDIEVLEGFGDDESYWYALDKISIEVDVEYKGDEKITDLELNWVLYDQENDNEVYSGDESMSKLGDGDDTTVTIEFTLDDPSEFEDQGEYRLYIWVTGEDQEDDLDLDVYSIDYEEITINVESDFMALSNINVPEVVPCDSQVQILADLWNMGEDDQEEITVIIYNKELGINEEVFFDEIDAFESETLDVLLEVPQGMEEKTHYLKITIYDEDNDVYENSEDDKAEFSVSLKVEGNCAVAQADVTADYATEEIGQAGKPLVIKSTIVNSGDSESTYTVSTSGYADWASDVTSDYSTITLAAGESQEVQYTFNVKEDVEGTKTFNIELLSEGELVATQPVQVEVAPKKALSGNIVPLLIGLISIVLVVIIIVLAVKIARK